MTNQSKQSADVENQNQGQAWFYSPAVKDHFFNPRNFLRQDPGAGEFNGVGIVGSPACGDKMQVWIKVEPETEKITACGWRTFGCASAIAATSMMSAMVLENGGRTLEEARQIKPQDIMERLGGLPARKIHCSVLGDRALRAAINDYYQKQGKNAKIKEESGYICPFNQQCKKTI